ncbi:MAG TPA: DcaP family trimeric outer membrane transporter, partial [Stellaceae bacterium]|nr:DcaP family trimeric outer membrane transporter [Stellaceae bacterium]
IYDTSTNDNGGSSADVIAPSAIPLNGTASHQEHGSTRLHAKQSNFSFDVRTPTAYGELNTFILVDFFGQNTAFVPQGSNTQNARLVLAYGTLGPLLAGQFLSLWFDGDAIGETVDPTASVGVSNGLTNRQPQFRYTYAGANGLSIAASVEEPVWEDYDNTQSAVGFAATGLGATTTAAGAGAWSRWPDFIVRGRWDQAWGHIGIAGLVKDNDVYAIGVPRVGDTGYGGMISGHLNTFGKDTLRAEAMVGKALGHYLSDMGSIAGTQSNLAAAGSPIKSPLDYGGNVSYTHWWTDQLRSTVMGGYSHVTKTSVITSAVAAAALDDHHIGATVNLIWSPVPQVDLGLEYDYIDRVTSHALTGNNSNQGEMDRVEAMAVFKF